MTISTCDHDIRAALRRTVVRRAEERPMTRVIEELGVLHGWNRIDIAILGRKLHGYEIKSDRDTLDRLPQQVASYNQVFDLVTLVVGWRHAAAAMREAPRWWGITLAESNSPGAVRLSTLRIPYFEFHIALSTLRTPYSKLHTPYCSNPHSTLHIPHTTRHPPYLTLPRTPTHSIFHTPHVNLQTAHSRHHTAHFTLHN